MHLFRKYINNRGSALFMVISIMTAIMVSCMAMYFSVISSRSTQYAVFNQQQSKSSAVSVADAILAGMMDNNVKTLNPLLAQMLALGVGEKLTTDGNGFAAFDPSATGADDPNLGSYMVEITRISENTFDIMVTASVNGVKDAYHMVIDIEQGATADPGSPNMQMFAATGYVPNDVFLGGGVFVTDVFFDNEITYVHMYNDGKGGGAMNLYGNLATGGSIVSKSYFINMSAKQAIYAIRGDYETYFNGGSTFEKISEAKTPSEGERHIVMIGGNCTFAPDQHGGGCGFTNADVYILGDLIINGAGNIGSDNSNYFVNGNVTVSGNVSPDLSTLRLNGTFDQSKNSNKVNKLPIQGWGTEEGFAKKGFLTKAEMTAMLDERTQSNEYSKWIINDYNPSGDKYVVELNESNQSTVHKKTLVYRSDPHLKNQWGVDWSNVQLIPTIILKYNNDKTKGYVEKGCIIEDIKIEPLGNQFTHYALIIDTGDDEDNVYTIRLKANRDLDGDGKKETFTWLPEDPQTGWDGSTTYALHPFHIFVKGRGSVVIDIPEGVTYQDQDQCSFMHYNWAVLGGLSTSKVRNDAIPADKDELWNDDGKYWISNVQYSPSGFMNDMKNKFVSFIHTDCYYKKDASGKVTKCGCSYSEVDSGNKCDSCKGKMKVIKCSVHGRVSEYCPSCNSDEKFDATEGAYYGECKDRVGKEEIDKYLNSHSDINNQMEKDSEGKLIYPHVNVYLVSCAESANIRLSDKEKNSLHQSDASRSVQDNSFFGYIYAPYMTFKGFGHNSSGDKLKIMGGMTVSDYVIEDSAPYAACWPDKLPEDLMSNECRKNKLNGLAAKTWKISLTGH